MLHNTVKRMSVILSIVFALTSVFPANAFAANFDFEGPTAWDMVPNLAVEEEPAQSEDLVEIQDADEELVVLRGAEVEVLGSELGMKTEKRDYKQPSFYPKEGYDAISAFITSDDSNETYEGKVYFVISGNGQWLMYNYKEATANAYFDKVEDFKGMLVPSKKADERADNPDTVSIDEAKIPLIKRSAFNGMYCNWRSFSQIDFTTGEDGKLVYATYEVEVKDEDKPAEDDKKSEDKPSDDKPAEDKPAEDKPSETPSDDKPEQKPEDKPAEQPTDSESQNQPGQPTTDTNPGSQSENDATARDEHLPSPSWNSPTNSKWLRYTVSFNSGNTYRVFITRSVSFNGKKHVGVNQKAGKKKINDINVWIFCNGQEVQSNLYKLKFKQNINCNGYAGNAKNAPYVNIQFKFKNKALKLDKKAMKKKAFTFYINPVNLNTGSVALAGKKATFTGQDGTVIKMKPLKANGKGDYNLANQDGKQVILGVNNFTGSVAVGTAAPANSNNNNPATGNNGGIY